MIGHVARRVARFSIRLTMASLRQCVSLVICLSVVGTIFILTYLHPNGQWTPASRNLDKAEDQQRHSLLAGKISVDGEFLLAQLRSRDARLNSTTSNNNNNNNHAGRNNSNSYPSSSGKRRINSRSSSRSSYRRRCSSGTNGRNNAIGSRSGRNNTSVVDHDCGQNEDVSRPSSFTREELGLADIHPPNKTRRPRKPDPEKPENEGKIAAVLKSRNRCWLSETKPNKLACLPFYYLAGFPKCGTTDLFRRLTSHPDVVHDLRYRKEMHWVSRSRFRAPFGSTDALDTYTLYMGSTLLHMSSNHTAKNNVSKAIIGDNSVSTLWDNGQWRRIPANRNCSQPRVITADVVRHLNPRAKILVIVRNPSERLYSEFLFFRGNCSKELFHQLVLKAIWEATKCFQRYSLQRCVYEELRDLSPRIHLGLYEVYIADWLKRFPRDQIHVIRLEDMAVNRKEVLLETLAFLGVDVPENATLEWMVNRPVARAGWTARTEGPMLEVTRAALDDFYLPFNMGLATLLNDSKYRYD